MKLPVSHLVKDNPRLVRRRGVSVTLTLSIYIWQVLGSNLRQEIGHPEVFVGYSSVTPQKFRGITRFRPRRFLPYPFQFMFSRPTIRRSIVCDNGCRARTHLRSHFYTTGCYPVPDESSPHILTGINILLHLLTAFLNYFYLHVFKSKFACIDQHEGS